MGLSAQTWMGRFRFENRGDWTLDVALVRWMSLVLGRRLERLTCGLVIRRTLAEQVFVSRQENRTTRPFPSAALAWHGFVLTLDVVTAFN